MKLAYSDTDEAFRRTVRDFVAAELPDDVRRKVRLGQRLQRADWVAWYRRLYARGWATPNWSPEWGGTTWTPLQRHIFDVETQRGDAPRMVSSGIMMLGPVLIAFGTDAQKQRHLPAIQRSDVWWCQGFSEPGAGSDLASLKTTAVRDGAHYVLNGQKTWTSYAQFSDWMFCLARTDPAARKPQEGISFLLVDLKTPGVTVRPIATLDGGRDLNEVFLDDVRVPVDNLVGREHQGWTCAKHLLGHERGGIAGIGAARQQLQRLRRLAGPLLADPVFAAQVHRLEIGLMALEATALRALGTGQQSASSAAAIPMIKVRGTELRQAIARLTLEVAGPEAAVWPDAELDDAVAERRGLAPAYLDARKFSIYGGTNEVQRNLIARALLDG